MGRSVRIVIGGLVIGLLIVWFIMSQIGGPPQKMEDPTNPTYGGARTVQEPK
ncbi:MAG: hypothetical protein WCP29_18600 [Acidobacteriota bacterium]